ncbi:GyrI-like domain-containing protein [Sporomusa sp.]|uniref:GyrI-like domain-containing protein n=1 Tax=Sporomusa sp. TaxID=2078658 RepID=UPI002C158188|nr:GyrI-like domain-containing protein [Sporomusa sp.]HWR07600.1 GyrI-like domain-containing protein [Sporomusa sp.]
MGSKIDYKKELKELYLASSKACSITTVPAMNFLMIDGRGNPNNSLEFQNAVEALFSVAYTLKFMIKKIANIDYGVMPLEGLWWCDDMEQFSIENKDIWKWTLMIMQPSHITRELFSEAAEKVSKEKGLVAVDKVNFGTYEEGKAAQILHIGPFSGEGPTVAKLHTFISDNQYQMNGKHHEIYLSDTRRGKPENWKTIIRQPIA